jgi:hypothetical protein
MFFVGQKVVCAGNRPWPDFSREGYVPALPVPGNVYTVRRLLKRREWDEGGMHLVEIVNPRRRDDRGRPFELAFRQSRFRPLRVTNIDVFLEMLEPAPVRVERRELIEVPS